MPEVTFFPRVTPVFAEILRLLVCSTFEKFSRTKFLAVLRGFQIFFRRLKKIMLAGLLGTQDPGQKGKFVLQMR